MILGIGIDVVEVERCAQWHLYTRTTLSRLFSEQEIEYCVSASHNSAERFAVRFAAREAFFKAFTAMNPHHSIPFLTVCKHVIITKNSRNPVLQVTWDQLIVDPIFVSERITTHISLTHTKTVACAYVIINYSTVQPMIHCR